MRVQIVTPYHVSHLQLYGDTVRDNVTSVYPPKDVAGRKRRIRFLFKINVSTFRAVSDLNAARLNWTRCG
jgi:hypothetical protein